MGGIRETKIVGIGKTTERYVNVCLLKNQKKK